MVGDSAKDMQVGLCAEWQSNNITISSRGIAGLWTSVSLSTFVAAKTCRLQIPTNLCPGPLVDHLIMGIKGKLRIRPKSKP
ncbi:unnamed protein product [Linum trigynum]|uniref:Uncharacterized protein n=1 Tax=Linum trigynum TaxID=586398 RepID=A0AAV2DGY9_9ROSI